MCDNRYLASSYASKDKKADILQAYVEQYYRMAMDHYTKAGTMSQILLGFVTAMLVIIGYDNHINGSLLDIMGATMVFIIGGGGSVWAARQMERYRYWEFIAFTYQKKLKKLVPELHKRTEHAPDDIQREHLFDDNKKDGKKKKVLPLFIYRLQDKYMWIALNFFIAIFGITLIVVSLSCRIFCVMCV